MHFALLLMSVGQLQAATPDSVVHPGPVMESAAGVTLAVDTVHPRRHRAIEHTDAYYTRLTIHRIGSYTMLPLFVGEYALGQQILNGKAPPGNWMRPAHAGVAAALGTLFVVNTVTGGWNLWDDRHDSEGRALRYLHTSLMLASDAGFVATGLLGGPAKHDTNKAIIHRNVAVGSMALSTIGTAIMWFRRD